MTPQTALTELLNRLVAQQGTTVHIGGDELNTWPAEAVAAMKRTRLLVNARPAASIVCRGCERECAMPVHIFASEKDRPAHAFIACDKPEDKGRIEVESGALERWRSTSERLAGAMFRLLGYSNPPQVEVAGKRWALGLLAGKENKGAVTLSMENEATLALAGQSIPLAHMMALEESGLIADRDALLRMVEGDTRPPAAGIGSPAWRKQKAKAAAGARHGKPGGSHDLQKRMRAAWASGKYTSRDRCAEEECAALGISYSTARKALRNTPEPKRT